MNTARKNNHRLHRYHYDKAGRLIGEEGAHTANYRFDPAGNRQTTLVFAPASAQPVYDPEAWAQEVKKHLDDPDFNLLGEAPPVLPNPPSPQPTRDNRVRELDA